MATAVVRTRGKWTRTPPPHRKGTTAILVGAAAVTNLNWATDLLARLAKIDVGARSHHAEALALTPGGRSQARVMLESLATTDQIPDATGWELLSDLRAENGESGASKIASIKALEMEGSLSPRAKRQPISFE